MRANSERLWLVQASFLVRPLRPTRSACPGGRRCVFREVVSVTFDPSAALEILRHGEEHARRRAVAELAGSGRREAIAPLLVAVGDESWAVRQAAVEGLARLPPDGAPAGARGGAARRRRRRLAQRGDGDLRPARGLRGGAAAALATDPDEEVRLFACVMLGSIKDEAAVPGLVAALSDPDTNVRHAAATSLGQIGSQAGRAAARRGAARRAVAAVPGAARARRDRRPARGARARGAARRRAAARARARRARAPGAARRAAAHRAPPARPRPRARNAAIRAVVEIEQRATASGESLDPAVQAALRREELVTHLVAMLADEDARNRRTAAVTLGWLRESRATAPLIGAARRPGGARVREPRAGVDRLPGPRSSGGAGSRTRTTRCGSGRCAASPGSRRPRARRSRRRSSTTPRPRCARKRRRRSGSSATRTRRCCCSSCSATRAS